MNHIARSTSDWGIRMAAPSVLACHSFQSSCVLKTREPFPRTSGLLWQAIFRSSESSWNSIWWAHSCASVNPVSYTHLFSFLFSYNLIIRRKSENINGFSVFIFWFVFYTKKYPFNMASPVIADPFHRMKYMERHGSGLRKIVRETEKPPGYTAAYNPKIFSTATDFRVDVYKRQTYHTITSVYLKTITVRW